MNEQVVLTAQLALVASTGIPARVRRDELRRRGLQGARVLRPTQQIEQRFDSFWQHGARRSWSTRLRGSKLYELRHVVRSARLRSGSETRLFPATKGLPSDDGAGDFPVHVQVARLHVLDEILLLALIQAVKPRGQSVVGVIGDTHGVTDVCRFQDRKQRAKELGAMATAASFHSEFDARADQTRVARIEARLEQP